MRYALPAAAALLLLAFPAAAQTAGAKNAAVAPARLALGRELAEVLNSKALTRTQIKKMMDVTLPQQVAADPNFATMERDHPGISAAVIASMRTIVIEESLQLLPSLWTRLAPVYANELDERELTAMLAFYRSPTGVRLIETMGRDGDYSQLIARQLRSGGEAEIDGEDLKSGAAPGIASAIRSSTPEDEVAYAALTEAISPQRINALNEKAQAEVLRWSSEPSPEAEAKVQAAVVAAMAPFLGRTSPSSGNSQSKVEP